MEKRKGTDNGESEDFVWWHPKSSSWCSCNKFAT